eukprot:6535824-Prorocentrum_lima.AAC.1
MICQEYPENGKKAGRYLFKNYNHEKGLSKGKGSWWTGSTWFKIKNVIAEYQSTGLDIIVDNTLQRALMTHQ